MVEEVFDLLSSHKKTAPEGYTFYLDGSISQMVAQKNLLVENGFNVQQSGTYPVLKKEDKKEALILIFENKIDGWWHFIREYPKFNICTEEECQKILTEQVATKKKKSKNYE